MAAIPLLKPFPFGAAQKTELDKVGHIALPGVLTDRAQIDLTAALQRIEALLPATDPEHLPNRYAAEFDDYLALLIGHPQLLGLARAVLGEDIRYDHCVTLNRPGGNGGSSWHSHSYGEEEPHLGFLRIFFYLNGFEPDDGGLKVVPGSHLWRDAAISADSDQALQEGWMRDKVNPHTGERLKIEALSLPPGSVVLMWTHAAHGVSPRQGASPTRWTVVYAYRNPGLPSAARWLTPKFERRKIPGAEGLLSLY